MEVELEPRVKPLSYKVKAISRESPSQKAANVLDSDLRSHWSSGTNTKEWILLELDEPCLLSHIRIYNKSVLEWEIAVGLRYKPETFVKVRPRCEAPRRDMTYSMNYTPCRYVRISCLRGNPIAMFFIQLIGVTVTGLETEFQPVANHLLPQIISHKQDAHDLHLQLLQDMTNRLLPFLPQLEGVLASFSDAADSNLRFLAMLSGPFYPILHVVREREEARSSGSISETEVSRNNQPSSSLTVSSNFEPRRSRNVSSVSSTSSSIVFRPDVVFLLLRKAYSDSDLGTICRMASRILEKLTEPCAVQDVLDHSSEIPSGLDEAPKSESLHTMSLVDYSELFGAEFSMPDDQCDTSYLNVLDFGAVEEGIMHVLYACVSQPMLCSKLAEDTSDIWSALPLVQALLPALRPSMGSFDHVDDNFSHWKQPYVQQALSQVVAASSSSVYRPLLHACAGYLSSYSPSHAKAACVLMDLCSSVFAPWMAQVIAKVDLALELLEEFLGIIQGARHSLSRARAALKCIVLALSGHMDDILRNYKEVKHRILFLVEMLEPFLDPAIAKLKSTIAFGDVSSSFPESQEHNCMIALNIIRKAVRKPAVLPSLEAEWRRGAVAPSVLLSLLDPHMQLPAEIDLCKSSVYNSPENVASNVSAFRYGGTSAKSNGQDEPEGKTDAADISVRMDVSEDVSLFFAPSELQGMVLTNFSNSSMENNSNVNQRGISVENPILQDSSCNKFQNGLLLDVGFTAECTNLQADYYQLRNYHDCELRASEFQRLSLDLHSQQDVTVEGHEAAIDALLLAAECYVNPYFMMSLRGDSPKFMNQLLANGSKALVSDEKSDSRRDSGKNAMELEKIGQLERRRDKIVLELLLKAADLDKKYYEKKGEHSPYNNGAFDEQLVELSLLDTSADAVTLVRQNQAVLCSFLIHQLQREQQLMHEILMHSLVFLLHSATKLYCAPENVIDIILRSAKCLNGMLTSFYYQLKEGNLPLDPDKIHGIQRRWILLQKLVIASTGGDLESHFAINSNTGCQYGTLIPPSAWMQRISLFSGSSFPLVRFLGWMAVSRNAKQYIKDRLFLASDLVQLTGLLSIFADDLAVVDNVTNYKSADVKIDQGGIKEHPTICNGLNFCDQKHKDLSFHVIYPDLCKFFPNMKLQFETFGETILEAVGLQLKSLPSSLVPDILCWFSDLCLWPFSPKNQAVSESSSIQLKGYEVKNARAIILYILEAIVVEHMEAMVPEIPRVVQVLESLCRASYCDVSFVDAILQLLKPIISYTLCKVPDDESLFVSDSCLNFESLCFEELFVNISKKAENSDSTSLGEYSRALAIFVLGTVFPDLSFSRKREMLGLLVFWANFAVTEPTNSFHDYLCAFQCVMDSCNDLLVHNLRVIGVIPLQLPNNPDVSTGTAYNTGLGPQSCFLQDVCQSSRKLDNDKADAAITTHKDYNLSTEEIEEFARDLEVLISKINPSIELCWSFHHQLTKNLTIKAAECLVYVRCLSSGAQKAKSADEHEAEVSLPAKSIEEIPVCWTISLKGLAEVITKVQESQCWEVASVMLDCLLGVPHCFCLDNVIGVICSAIKTFCCRAPKITWRLKSNNWLSILCERGIHSLNESEVPVVDLFCTLLGHFEPEQRFIALKYLGKLVGQDVNGGLELWYSKFCSKLVSPGNFMCVSERIISLLVTSTWDRVAVLASSDTSFPLRIRAMALLIDFIPFAERHQLQSFLVAADTVLCGMGSLAHPACEGPLVQLSLPLLAGACLYCPADDINLIPQGVWQNIEIIASSKIEGKNGDMEKKVCQILCKLRDEGEDAKEVLKEVLSSTPTQYNPDFGKTRESILQVLSNLNSVQSYFDVFSRKTAQEVTELEEAELELDILQKEHAVQELSPVCKEGCHISYSNEPLKDNNRIQQIKDQIRSLEKSKLKEDIIARRQKKLQMRHARQKYLEEAALREAELLQGLDRERTAQAEREIERQRLLEVERAKTRELRYNLDMEKERQTQRELQRELEQAETGVRLSRRDFSSSAHTSRPRDRYRERDNGRSGHEGSARSGQVPTILQSRERSDECGSSYEENLDGSKDSGDTCSIGDPEIVSAYDGQSSGFGPAQRHGSRGGKSRQVIERREREGRREGKWERKH